MRMVNLHYIDSFTRQYERFREEVKQGAQWESGMVVGSTHNMAALHAWFVELCSQYVSLDGETRTAVRAAFEDYHMLGELLGFPESFRKTIRSPADIQLAKTALVALAIVDRRFDNMEYSSNLEDLCRTSKRAGIPIAETMREIAALDGAMSEKTKDLWLHWAGQVGDLR